jgi:hypothetical protein
VAVIRLSAGDCGRSLPGVAGALVNEVLVDEVLVDEVLVDEVKVDESLEGVLLLGVLPPSLVGVPRVGVPRLGVPLKEVLLLLLGKPNIKFARVENASSFSEVVRAGGVLGEAGDFDEEDMNDGFWLGFKDDLCRGETAVGGGAGENNTSASVVLNNFASY